jgi:hypothetical protein
MSLKFVVANFFLFQVGWFTCVYSGAYGVPVFSVVVALAVSGLALAYAADKRAQIVLTIIVIFIGTLFDSLLNATGWLTYASPLEGSNLAPIWIVSLWACFASTLNVSMRWIRNRRIFASILGAIGGPLAYLGGGELGAVVFNSNPEPLLLIATGWAALLPLFAALSIRYDGWLKNSGHELASMNLVKFK